MTVHSKMMFEKVDEKKKPTERYSKAKLPRRIKINQNINNNQTIRQLLGFGACSTQFTYAYVYDCSVCNVKELRMKCFVEMFCSASVLTVIFVQT